MKAYFLFTSTGLKAILTSYDSIEHPALLKKLKDTGIAKFIAVSLESTRDRYEKHFDALCNDLNEIDDLRLLDDTRGDSSRKFSFNELSDPTYCAPKQGDTMDIYLVGV